MLLVVLTSLALQNPEHPPVTYGRAITCATATMAYSTIAIGDEQARMSRASAGWSVLIREIWDASTTPYAQLEADVRASSDEHAQMLNDDPSLLFQLAVGCYGQVVAIAAAQANSRPE